MDSETREIIDHFLTESREAVAEVEPLLMELEAEGGTPDRAAIDTIFRLFHSMKGSAGFLEFKHIEGVTHHAETLLDRIRTDDLTLSGEVVDLLCRAIDFTNDALDCVEATAADAEMAEVSAKLMAVITELVDKDRSTDEASADDSGTEVLHGFVLPDEVADASLASDPQPGGDAQHETPGMVAIFDQPMPSEPMAGEPEFIPELATESVTRPASVPSVDAENAALAGVLQRFVEAASQTDAAQEAPMPAPPEDEPSVVSEPQAAVEGTRRPLRRRADYLRVDVRKLDQLMDLIGELIIAETAVTHGPQQAPRVDGQSKAAVQLNRVTRGLQDVAMSLRMVPIHPTFMKMKRLVRDLSKKQGKQVHFSITGEDTEVDKSVVEAISDPLVHLLRNAIDHGIESADDRMSVGKPEGGTISLTARQQAGEIRITVHDDGRGLDRERILRKAISAGLVHGSGADLTDGEVFRLIFEPGFSTAAAVTDISGRGVGMDVVRQNIEAVKGRVEVASVKGQGTSITIRIPLTLAIIEGMLVRVGDTRFTIPMLSILETVVVGDADVTSLTNGLEVARIRGQLLPVFRLHQFYEIDPDSAEIQNGLLVVVEDGHDRLCLLVDELVGQRQTVIKPLSGYLGNVRGLAGCTVLGDGSISLIIDVAKLILETRKSTAA